MPTRINDETLMLIIIMKRMSENRTTNPDIRDKTGRNPVKFLKKKILEIREMKFIASIYCWQTILESDLEPLSLRTGLT